MAIRPGDKKNGFVWTGRRWVREPQRQADKVRIRKEIESYQRAAVGKGSVAPKSTAAGLTYPGGTPRMTGVAQSRASEAAPTTKNYSAGAKRYRPMASAPSKKSVESKASSTATPSTQAASSSKRPSTNGTAKQSKSKPVSQSRTMWVAKGTRLSDGTIAQRGYLAQYGKDTKKVTGRVRLETKTGGKKAGSVVSYRKGKKA